MVFLLGAAVWVAIGNLIGMLNYQTADGKGFVWWVLVPLVLTVIVPVISVASAWFMRARGVFVQLLLLSLGLGLFSILNIYTEMLSVLWLQLR
ncbi:hypothetical protein [Canibacter zhoujuaniae]|nr:hypothetical protein [Canibacter zhoujuaniae]